MTGDSAKISSVTTSQHAPSFTVAGLFAGIGGLEAGFRSVGGEAKLLCEIWEPAVAVLETRFPNAELAQDVRELGQLPDVDVVTAGFPCTDLSQAGRTTGIHGQESGLVKHLFRLLENASPRWVVIENVRNMLVLDKGAAMDHLVERLEGLGFRWAYRLVDSRFTGVPQRRQRVIFVASRDEDPTEVLFADEAGEPSQETYRNDAYGFYWTEGLTGVGWAQDAIPTLKGGSTIGIPSAPAVWVPDRAPGTAIGTPGIRDAERMQGFAAGWTEPAENVARASSRWKLVGNAVTVGVAEWLGHRLTAPGQFDRATGVELTGKHRWPTAAWGQSGERWQSAASMWPQHKPYQHLLDLFDLSEMKPLSKRATDGFHSRMERSTLRFDERFRLAIKEHADVVGSTG